jgi:dTDP-4-amino-4,6-dideoxygalactose transaminase
LHLQPAYSYLNLTKGSYPISERLAGEILSLPMYPELDASQIEWIGETVKSTLENE